MSLSLILKIMMTALKRAKKRHDRNKEGQEFRQNLYIFLQDLEPDIIQPIP